MQRIRHQTVVFARLSAYDYIHTEERSGKRSGKQLTVRLPAAGIPVHGRLVHGHAHHGLRRVVISGFDQEWTGEQGRIITTGTAGDLLQWRSPLAGAGEYCR